MFESSKLEWYVYIENFNGKTIEPYNIFNHWLFRDSCDKVFKKNKGNLGSGFDIFSKEIKSELQYYFWSKCEYEIILMSIFKNKLGFKDVKIDVYDQVILNWDCFINWLWREYWLMENQKKG